MHLADLIIDGGEPMRLNRAYPLTRGYPIPGSHPYDDGLVIGVAHSLRKLPATVDAVVSLCRVADGHIPAHALHLDVRLIDQIGENLNLDFVLADTVWAIEALREQGRTVFVHCVGAISRTPTIAALYGARLKGVTTTGPSRTSATCCPKPIPIPISARHCDGSTQWSRPTQELRDGYRAAPGFAAVQDPLPRVR